MIILHLILHSAVRIYDFHILITYRLLLTPLPEMSFMKNFLSINNVRFNTEVSLQHEIVLVLPSKCSNETFGAVRKQMENETLKICFKVC